MACTHGPPNLCMPPLPCAPAIAAAAPRPLPPARPPARRRSPLAAPLRGVRSEDLLVDAVLGIVLFKVG